MIKLLTRWLPLALCGLLMVSCQKAVYEENEPDDGEGVTLRFNVTQFEQIPFDKAFSKTRGTQVDDVCSRINLAVYQNGKRVEQINQRKDSTGFGTIKVKLKKGRYLVVLLAHNGDANPTMTDPEKIVFRRANKDKGRQITDTFWFSDSINVNEDSTCNLKLKRATSMFRMIITDEIPSDVAKMRFYIKKAFTTLNALTGFGRNSTSAQWDEIDVTSEMRANVPIFDVYTFPRAENDTISIEVSARNKNDETPKNYVKSFDKVPIKRNNITVYKGRFFSSGGDDDPGGDGGDDAGDGKDMGFTIDLLSEDEWTTTEYSY